MLSTHPQEEVGGSFVVQKNIGRASQQNIIISKITRNGKEFFKRCKKTSPHIDSQTIPNQMMWSEESLFISLHILYKYSNDLSVGLLDPWRYIL